MSYAPLKTETVFAAQTITADANSARQINRTYRGVILDIDISAVTDTPSVVFNIQAESPDNTWTTILASAAQTAAGHLRMIVYPGTVAVANLVLNQPLPRKWRLQADGTWGGTDGITFQALATLVP